MSSSERPKANLLLRALSELDLALLEPHFKHEQLKLGYPVFSSGEPIERVYFLESGVASITSEQEGGDQVEVGLYGFEGMSGSAVVLGAEQSPHTSMVQVGNPTGFSIASDRLAAVSNAHYALPERLARWLLMCHDRIEGDRIELTHEFIAMMLAVRRSGVTVTLHTLEGTGAIRSTRGVVTVVNRERLEEIAGDAYGQPENEYRRLIGPFGKGRHGMATVQ